MDVDEPRLRGPWGSILAVSLAYLVLAAALQFGTPVLLRSSGLPRAQWRTAAWAATTITGLLITAVLFRHDRGLTRLFRVGVWQYALATVVLAAAALFRVQLGHQSLAGTAGALAFFTVGVAFVEETVFRGFIWHRLEELFTNRWWVLLASSLIFTAWHVPAWIVQGAGFAPLTPAIILAIGVVLGLVRLLSRGLPLPTALHAAIDLLQN